MELNEALTMVTNLCNAETNPDRVVVYNQCLAIFSEVGKQSVVARYQTLYEANRVNAIKAYRAEFNTELMTAKRTIEEMAKKYNWKQP